VKIAPGYEQGTLHVLDASRAVGVVGKLLSENGREDFIATNTTLQDELREKHYSKRKAKPLLPIAEARARATQIDWRAEDIPQPEFTGVRSEDDFPLETLVEFIDWSPFFHAWELQGRYPKIFDDATVGDKAKELFDDAKELLDRIVGEKLFTAKCAYGFFPANRIRDDVELFTDDTRTKRLAKFHFLRQQNDKASGENHSLADFIAPGETGLADHLGAFGFGHFHEFMAHIPGLPAPFIGQQKHRLSQVKGCKFRVYRHRHNGIGNRDIFVFQPCPLRTKQHTHLLPLGNKAAGVFHGALWRHHGFGQVTIARRGGKNKVKVLGGFGGGLAHLNLVQHPPRAGGERNRLGVWPAIARVYQPHPIQPEIPHRPRRRADVFPHLRLYQNNGGRRPLPTLILPMIRSRHYISRFA